jgi:hemoglobin
MSDADQSDADRPAGRRSLPVTPARSVPVTPTSGDDDGDGDDRVTVTVFTAVGGSPFFVDLVTGFYRRVAQDPVLLPLYPDAHDLGPAADRLTMFLEQYWGGPTTYADERGHPRLRMRHVPFTIGPTERDHWLTAMLESLDEVMPGTPLDDVLRAELHARMVEYFTMAAEHLVNADG